MLVIGLLATLGDLLKAHFKWIPLKKSGPWFDEADQFSEAGKARLMAHYERMAGTLIFWKNKAALYEKLSRYAISWAIMSGVLLPALIQVYDKSNIYANFLLTLLIVWTTILSAFSRSFKAEELYRSFRHWESEYYDLSRRLLDRRIESPNEENSQIDLYISAAEKIRQAARDAETSNQPKVDI
jgi:hypothetical protein